MIRLVTDSGALMLLVILFWPAFPPLEGRERGPRRPIATNPPARRDSTLPDMIDTSFVRRAAARAGLMALRASLLVSPRPMVWAIRREFSRGAVARTQALRAAAPREVTTVIGEQYDAHAAARLDVYSPTGSARAGARLPTVVWVHGGGFVGGSKDEIGGYLAMLAVGGFTVVGVDYTLAPAARHPMPARQVMRALRHLEAHAERLRVDPSAFVLAGDSAGAHIVTQVALCTTNPAFAELIGVQPTIAPHQLRGVALCCGVFDPGLLDPDSPLTPFAHALWWAYSGSRRHRDDRVFTSAMAVPQHVTGAFPPTFVTVGNADLVAEHSHVMVAALESNGVDVETLLFPDDHQPPLPHEYQFDLHFDDAKIARERLIQFCARCTRAPQ